MAKKTSLGLKRVLFRNTGVRHIIYGAGLWSEEVEETKSILSGMEMVEWDGEKLANRGRCSGKYPLIFLFHEHPSMLLIGADEVEEVLARPSDKTNKCLYQAFYVDPTEARRVEAIFERVNTGLGEDNLVRSSSCNPPATYIYSRVLPGKILCSLLLAKSPIPRSS